MRLFFLIFVFCIFQLSLDAQPLSAEKDNYTVQYLIIFNKKNEILLMKNKLGWHTPAVRSNKPESIKESLESLAETIGIKIKDIRLSGLYVHKFEGLTDHPEVCFRSHYTAQTIDENPKMPTVTTGPEYHWVDRKKALQLFHFDFLKEQTKPILDNPSKVWGGTFMIIWKDDEFQGSKIIEPIYSLSN